MRGCTPRACVPVSACKCVPLPASTCSVVGDVIEFDPPHRFVHSHRFTQHDDPVCQVAYELKQVAGGVEVTMRIIDMPAGTATAKSMQKGGNMILTTLKAIAETGKPPAGIRLMYVRLRTCLIRVARAYAQRALAAVTTNDRPRRQQNG